MTVKIMETTKAKTTTTEMLESLIGETFENPNSSFLGSAETREEALKSFVELGIPGRKSEEYKYVNVDLAIKNFINLDAKATATNEQIQPLKLFKEAIVLVIENGKYVAELSKLPASLPNGLTITSIRNAFSNNPSLVNSFYSKSCDGLPADPFALLNTAIAQDGTFIHLAKNCVVEKPIQILHVSSTQSNVIANPRNLVIVDENAQLTVVETFNTVGLNTKVFNNALTEFFVAENAVLDHYKVQDEDEAANLINATHIIQKDKSVASTHTFSIGGSLVRNNLNIVLNGQFTETHLNGLYLTKGNQTVDNHTLVDHRMPNCNSNELYKGIIDEKSSATFNGKIFVRKDAQKTNAFQSNKNILLSDDGTINTKPQLEIYADDVKCSHGTSTGKIDEEKVFYLRSRGMSELSAKKLLMHAFASEVTDTIKLVELKEFVESKITERLI